MVTRALSSPLFLDQLEASTQHRRDIIACWLDIYNLMGQCFGHVSERNKKAGHVKQEGIFATLRANVSRNSRKCQNNHQFRPYFHSE